MANPNITREQLVYRVGLQIFLTLMAVVFTVVYTLPKLEAISEQNAETNAAIENYNSITNNGIPQTQLLSTINRIGNNSELAEVITRAGDKISTIILNGSQKKLSKMTLIVRRSLMHKQKSIRLFQHSAQ